jgi:hypothetical protein
MPKFNYQYPYKQRIQNYLFNKSLLTHPLFLSDEET